MLLPVFFFFATGGRAGGDRRAMGDGEKKKRREQIAAIMASRFLVMPLVAAGLLLTGAKAKLIPYDKLVWFVLLMEG